MGYYVEIFDSNWVISYERDVELLAALTHVAKTMVEKGDRYYVAETTEQIDEIRTLEGMLGFFGFDCSRDDERRETRIYYFDGKAGVEQKIMLLTGEYAIPGSWANWKGEDWSFWRYEVTADGTVLQLEGGIVWNYP